MPINQTLALSIGNAIRIHLTPAAGVKRWRVLRNATGIFSGYNDATASLIHDGIDRVILDTQALVNGQAYHYGMFVFNGLIWAADGVVATTPSASFVQAGADVLNIVRDRIEAGLQVIVDRSEVHHENGNIQVLTAPPLFEDTVWPVVTCHVQTDASADRGVGEMIGADYISPMTDLWESHSGVFSRTQLLIVAWCLNPDARNALRRAVKGILIGNLPVFDAEGMLQIDISQTDTEDFQSFGAPVYQTMTTLTCLSAATIITTATPIIRVDTKVTVV